MKRKIIKRKDIKDLNFPKKDLNLEKIFELIKKIGTPYTKDETESNRYTTT